MMGMKIAMTAFAVGLILVAGTVSAVAATTKFTSCASMHAVYKYGVSKDAKAQARAIAEGMYRPPVKAQVYADSYKSLDRDKDGTMCEVPK